MPKAKSLMQSNSSDGSVRHYNIEILNLFALELQLSNTKLVLKKQIKRKLKKFKAQTISVLEYKEMDDHKSLLNSFHSSDNC